MKKIMALGMSIVLALSMTACGGGTETKTENQPAAAGAEKKEEAKAGSPQRYSLGSGSSGGNFYLVGGGLSTVINNLLPEHFVITSEETGGSTANLTMIQNGDVEFGITMTSSIAEAVAGEAEWTGGPMDKIRGLAPLYPSYLTIYTLADSGIKTLDDVNGKIIGFGSKGAAMDSVFREAFPAMGINPSSIFNDGHGATATAVSDGQIDAALLFSLPPFAAITELEATKDLTFIGLTEEQQKHLVETYPFYKADVMPAGSYKGVTEDIPIVSEWNVLVTSSEVPEEEVYLITKSLMENNPDLVEIYKGLSYVTPENTLNFNCPLHPGTIKYLQEVGIEVPEDLIPAE